MNESGCKSFVLMFLHVIAKFAYSSEMFGTTRRVLSPAGVGEVRFE
jgi:hypothetical protein